MLATEGVGSACRHFERLHDILGALPPPGGPAAAELPCLDACGDRRQGPIVDWAAMPAACDPCRGGSLGGDSNAREAVATGLEDPREAVPDDSPGLPLRGRNKRWQARRSACACRPCSFVLGQCLIVPLM